MPKKFLNLVTLLLLMVAGVVGQSEAQPSSNGLTLADLESFANTESNIESNTEKEYVWGQPSNPWDYVPNRFLTCETKSYTVESTSDYQISIEGVIYSGDFIHKGHKYNVIVEICNCNGKQDGSWCDQRRVGARVISVIDPEQGKVN